MAAQTLTIPTAFQMEQIAVLLEGQALVALDAGDDMRGWTLSEHAANARNAADFLSRPCFTCAPAVQ